MGQDFHYGMHQPLDQKTTRTQLAKFLRLLHSNQVGSYLRYFEILLLVSRQESESLATSCSKHVPDDFQRNAWMVQVTAAVWLTRKNNIKWWTEDEQRINRGWIATLSHHIIFQTTSHRTIPNQHRAWCRYCRCPRGSQEIPGAAAWLKTIEIACWWGLELAGDHFGVQESQSRQGSYSTGKSCSEHKGCREDTRSSMFRTFEFCLIAYHSVAGFCGSSDKLFHLLRKLAARWGLKTWDSSSFGVAGRYDCVAVPLSFETWLTCQWVKIAMSQFARQFGCNFQGKQSI